MRDDAENWIPIWRGLSMHSAAYEQQDTFSTFAGTAEAGRGEVGVKSPADWLWDRCRSFLSINRDFFVFVRCPRLRRRLGIPKSATPQGMGGCPAQTVVELVRLLEL